MDNNVKVGDTVICINIAKLGSNVKGIAPPLKINGEYIVGAINTCACGVITYDVGISSPSNTITCTSCLRKTNSEPIWWCSASRFVKKQNLYEKDSKSETKSKEERIKEAIAIENYELAAELNKL